MKILITGASGAVGMALQRELAADHELILTSRDSVAPNSVQSSYQLDITDAGRMSSIMAQEKPQAVIHLAALIGNACEQDPNLAQSVNIESTTALASLAVRYGAKKFIFASTAAVYRQATLLPVDEYSNIDPQSVYGKTKLAAEKQLEIHAAGQNTTTFITTRIFNLYGPDFHNSLIYKLLHATAAEPVSFFGFEEYYRDYVHISDVVTAFDQLLTNSDLESYNVFNLAGGRATSNAALVKTMQRAGLQPHYNILPAAPSYSWANIEGLETAIDFKPQANIIFDL